MQENIKLLIDKYEAQSLTEQEGKELDDIIDQYPFLREQLDQLTGVEARTKALRRVANINVEENLQYTLKKVHQDEVTHKIIKIGTPVVLVVLFLIAGFYWWSASPKKEGPLLADRTPRGYKAVLTLPDGSSIALDTLPNGPIKAVAGVTKLDSNTLKYESRATPKPHSFESGEGSYTINSSEGMYTLQTRNAGTYRVILQDGTGVWLNNVSSLSYPGSFAGVERTVSLKGEAYFEVTSNSQYPFHVYAGIMNVEVLGTRFNVAAYDNETAITTTLLEGAVNLRKDQAHCRLKPGNQGIFPRDQKGRPLTDKSWEIREIADPDAIIAWKENKFSFSNASLSEVLRQLSRQYNLDIRPGGTPSRPYDLSVPRTVSLYWLLGELKLHYHWNGSQLIVTE